MNKYLEASQCYNNILKHWKMFTEGRDKTYNHAQIINNAIRLAQLGIPDPFAALNTGEVDIVEELKEEKIEEVKPSVAETVKDEPIVVKFGSDVEKKPKESKDYFSYKNYKK